MIHRWKAIVHCLIAFAASLIIPLAAGQTDLASAAKFEQRKFDVAGTRFAYRIRRGTGPTLVLVPGSFHDTWQWDEVLPQLGQDWTIMLVDIRGHGESRPPPKAGSIEQFAQDVIRMADDAKVDRFFVGGHSIGGMIALEVGRAFPKRVRGIISIEGWTNARVLPVAFGGHLNDTLTPELLKRHVQSRKRATGNWTDAQRKEFAEIWRHWDGSQFLKATDLPILELWGDRGRPLPTRNQMQIPDRPNIDLIWMPGASHSLPLERPTEIGKAITQFVTRVKDR